jgi:hypothetical protein
MTNELKDQLRQLVADPPPPTGVPSEAVFARVRTVRRRRAGGAALVATAAVVAVAIAVGNLANPNSAPPVTSTPGPTPVVTAPPTNAPASPAAPTTKPPIATSINTLPPVVDTNTPPPTDPSTPANEPSSPGTTTPPPVGPLELRFGFQPVIDGLTVTMRVNAEGAVLAPTFEKGGTMEAANFHDNLLYAKYWWGDGTYIEDNGNGGVGCWNAQKRVSGKGIKQIGKPHTYAKPGAYQFALRVTYCTPDGPREFTRAWDVIVTQPTSTP